MPVQDYSLGVTQLLDELLQDLENEEQKVTKKTPAAGKDGGSTEQVSHPTDAIVPEEATASAPISPRGDRADRAEAMDSGAEPVDSHAGSHAATTKSLGNSCSSLDAYLAFMESGEREAKKANLLKEMQAEGRLDFADTNQTGLSQTGLTAELMSHEARIAKVRAGILEELQRRESERAKEVLDKRGARSSARSSAAARSASPELDLEGLLAECEAMESETAQWRVGDRVEDVTGSPSPVDASAG